MGTRSEVSINEIGNFVSEAKNPANRLNIDVVDIKPTS